jgi:hypothetical protein
MQENYVIQEGLSRKWENIQIKSFKNFCQKKEAEKERL